MKIALIHFDLTTESGDPRMVLSIAKALHELGHSITVYTSEFIPEKCFPGLHKDLRVVVFPPRAPFSSVRGASGIFARVLERYKRNALYSDAALRVFRGLEKDFDYLIFENDYSYKIGVHYRKINPKTRLVWIINNVPFFHSKKESWLLNLASSVSSISEKVSARKHASGIDWIVVYDETAKALAVQIGPPVKIMRTPVDFKRFYAPPKRYEKNKQDVLRLISIGALSPQRRFEDTISTISILRRKGYNARALIISKDYWANQEYRRRFLAFVKESGVEGYLDIRLEGATDDEFLKSYRESDVFIFPNNIKIWGVGAFEAMAAGLPVVVSRVSDVASPLKDGESAMIVDPLRPDQIAAAVTSLVENPELYSRVAAGGQKVVQDQFTLENYAKEILIPPSSAQAIPPPHPL